MPVKKNLVALVNSLLSLVDAQLVRKSQSIDHLFSKPSFRSSPLPAEAANYLRASNPSLKELQLRYKTVSHPAAYPSVWTQDHIKDQLVLDHFRGDNAYVWQYRGRNTEVNYLLTTYYVKTIDTLGLLNLLEEDSLFGAYVFDFNEERLVSRDLLDSIVEIYFLEQTLAISSLSDINVLDIGAGYGRLAHRLVKALPRINKVFCVDSVAESTFISEYYLRVRGVSEKAVSVPLYDIESTLAAQPVYLAINVHSFSECSLASINWWLDSLKAYKVKFLMIVPNPDDHGGTLLLTTEKNGKRVDFLPSLTSRGYQLAIRQPKYRVSSVQKYGISPTYHYLFELSV